MKGCTHLDDVQEVGDPERRCEDCVKVGGRWVHLRQCLTCGHVGCCDSSPNRHATKHYRASQHPLARSIEPGEGWAWCYADEVMLEIG